MIGVFAPAQKMSFETYLDVLTIEVGAEMNE
jgi:hypothetical protein